MRQEKILLISGLEPSGAAGLLLDVRVIRHFGFLPIALATCTTSQIKGRVFWINPENPEKLIHSIIEFLPHVTAIKIGLVPTPDIANSIAAAIKDRPASVNVVFDPVLISSADNIMFWGGTYDSLFKLIEQVNLITPNFLEAKKLANIESDDPKSLCENLILRSAKAVLLKGGHLNEKGVDYLHDGNELITIEPEKKFDFSIRGSGCLLSSAIAAEIAKGKNLIDAAISAKRFFENSAQTATDLFGEYVFDIH